MHTPSLNRGFNILVVLVGCGMRDIQKAVFGIKTILCEQDLFVFTTGGGEGGMKLLVRDVYADNYNFKQVGSG